MKRYGRWVALLAVTACNSEITGLGPPSDPAKETFSPTLGVNISTMSRTADGVYYLDQVVGTGTEVTTETDSVRVTYAGYLKDGTLFDSGVSAKLVPDSVIAGFRSGMIGMREGGKRKIVIPSALGYAGETRRERQADGTEKIVIPRQSTLVFDLELLRAHNPAPTP